MTSAYDEDAVLGAMVIDASVSLKVSEYVKAGDFSDPRKGEIFRRIQTRFEAGAPADIDAVLRELKAAGLLGNHDETCWLIRIAQSASVTDAPYYAAMVAKSAKLRKLQRFASKLVMNATAADANPDALLADFKEQIESERWGIGSSNQHHEALRARYGVESPISIADLIAADYRDDYLIEGCLVANQAAVTAGPSKSCKTTIEVARSLALVTGEPFLGKFEVNRRCKVFFATAESGKATVQRTFKGMAGAMGIDLSQIDPDWLKINWWVPRINNVELLDYFAFEAEKSGAEVAIIDPLYQCLDDQQASYVLNGQQLAMLSNRLLRHGITPILLDHAKRSSSNAKDYEPLELEDISGAGKAEFFRQWMLISRRSKFRPSELGEPNLHDLWLTFGGSAGHASVWALDLSEHNTGYQSREYAVAIRTRCEAIEEVVEARDSEAKSKQEKRREAEEQRMQHKADELIQRVFAGDYVRALTQNDIADNLGLKTPEARRVIAILTSDGRLRAEPLSVSKNGRKYDGYRLGESLALTPWTGD